MTTESDIRAFASEVARLYNPEQIILFGSQARRESTEDSDVDILVIMDFEGSSIRLAAKIAAAVNPPFALDLLVRKRSEIESRIEQGDFFAKDILKEGKILYEAAYPRVAA